MTIRHFLLSLRYDIRYTKNFNRFLGGISRLSNLVGENPILLVHVHYQICLIDFVYGLCFFFFFFFLNKSEVFELKKKRTQILFWSFAPITCMLRPWYDLNCFLSRKSMFTMTMTMTIFYLK